MRGNAELCAWGRETVAPAKAVLAGSDHIARVLNDLVGPDPAQVHVVPPGVDVERFRPVDRVTALATLTQECRLDAPNPQHDHDERRPDAGNAERLTDFLRGDRKTVLYVGKLSPEKGVAMLLEALQRVDARAVVVGFGPSRAELEAAAGPDVLFTGPLEHRHLEHLWPLADVSVTPSVFPEAFGMVAAEAAACGSPPLVARQSGLAEVAAGLEAEYPERFRHLASFERGDTDDLAGKLQELLALPHEDWLEVSRSARRAAETLWSWEHVAERILQVGLR
jgi:glycosyltransferase involved in cell wall biosynthesis